MQEMDYYDYYQEVDYYIEGENIYFIFVKSTLVLYALVFIQEHNMVSTLCLHTCEKHSQCISLYKCTLLMTDPLDVRVGWYHIWHCFNGPERLMRGACLNKSPLERIFRFVEPPAQKPPLKTANMYQLFDWMARNSHLLAFLEHQNWEDCVHMCEQPSCEEVQVFSSAAWWPGACLFVFKYARRTISISVIVTYPLVWFSWKSSEPPKTKGDLKTLSMSLLIKVN